MHFISIFQDLHTAKTMIESTDLILTYSNRRELEYLFRAEILFKPLSSLNSCTGGSSTGTSFVITPYEVSVYVCYRSGAMDKDDTRANREPLP